MDKSTYQLKSGGLRLSYKNGAIRYLRWGEAEIIRMVYSAVRDENWEAVSSRVISEKERQAADSFYIKLKLEYKQHDIHYMEDISIVGKNNQIDFEIEGEALSLFKKNRIGLCILHPIKECAGKKCNVSHTDGSMVIYTFPEFISPRQPIMDIRSMAWHPEPFLSASIEFEGDVFEMEDQRNWTDASYKTYCTPLSLPFPVIIEKGAKIKQKIRINVGSNQIQKTLNKTEGSHKISVDTSRSFLLPSLGTCKSSNNRRLTIDEINLLKELPFNHYRIELKLYEDNWGEILNEASIESIELGWPLFIVMYCSDNYKNELKSFIKCLIRFHIHVKYCLPVKMNHISDDKLTDFAIRILKPIFPDIEIGAGVNAYFAELNRNRPKTNRMGFTNYTISPQVHAFDDASLVENLSAQGDTVKSAKRISPGQKIFISPITLKQRFNVVATSDVKDPLPGSLPSQADVRQCTNFAAGWLLSSIKYLSESGVGLITYFETVGWRGFIQGSSPPGLPGLFPSKAGDIFPVYKIMKELSGYRSIIKSISSSPLKFNCITVKNDSQTKTFCINFSHEKILIKIEGAEIVKPPYSFNGGQTAQLAGNRLFIQSHDIIIIELNH